MSKEELIKIAEELGYKLSETNHRFRKARSDKGKERGANSKPRSDKGVLRAATNGVSKDKYSMYKHMLTRYMNLEIDDIYDNPLSKDINGYYIEKSSKSIVKEGFHQVVSHGVAKFRTRRHLKTNAINMEKYRFEAMQELLDTDGLSIREHTEIGNTFWVEIEKTQAQDMLDLFCKFYHVREEDAIRVSYKTWESRYMIVCDQELPRDYIFVLDELEFGRMYANEIEANKLIAIEEIKSSKLYANYMAKQRDLCIRRHTLPYEIEMIQNSPDKTISQIRKEILSKIDQTIVDQELAELQKKYINDKLKEYNILYTCDWTEGE